MKKILKRLTFCLLAVLCMCLCNPTGITPEGTKTVKAASKNSDAKKLYKKFLKKKYTYINSTINAGSNLSKINLKYYAMVDINKDNVCELLVTDSLTYGISGLHIFTIKNNKVSYAGSWLHAYYPLRINKTYGGVAVSHSGTGYSGVSLISLKKGRSYQKKYIYGHEVIKNGNIVGWNYYSGKKKMSEAKYLKLRKKYVDTKKYLKYYKMKKNV